MKTLLFTLAGSALMAQQFPALPSTNNPYSRTASDYAGSAASAYRTSSEAKQKAQELKIQQSWLDLARQQAAAKSNGKPVSLADGGDVQQALLMANMAHPDFSILAPAMQIISLAIQPNWSQMTLGEYLECLYAIAKNASFAAELRNRLLAEAAAKSTVPAVVPAPAPLAKE